MLRAQHGLHALPFPPSPPLARKIQQHEIRLATSATAHTFESITAFRALSAVHDGRRLEGHVLVLVHVFVSVFCGQVHEGGQHEGGDLTDDRSFGVLSPLLPISKARGDALGDSRLKLGFGEQLNGNTRQRRGKGGG